MFLTCWPGPGPGRLRDADATAPLCGASTQLQQEVAETPQLVLTDVFLCGQISDELFYRKADVRPPLIDLWISNNKNNNTCSSSVITFITQTTRKQPKAEEIITATKKQAHSRSV